MRLYLYVLLIYKKDLRPGILKGSKLARIGMFYKGSISSKLLGSWKKVQFLQFCLECLPSFENVDLKVLIEQIWSKVEFSLPRLLFCLLCVWKQPLFSYNSILWTPESGVHISNDDLTMCVEEVGPPSSPETRCSWFFRRHFCRPCGSSRRSPCTSPEYFSSSKKKYLKIRKKSGL